MTVVEKGLPKGAEAAWKYPLFEALFKRRSRRFGLGMEIKEGPTKFKSTKEPLPLTELEEALLIAAATGVSGFNLSDMPHIESPMGPDRFEKLRTHEGGCNWQLEYTGRTWPSPCASHGTELFYTNDRGTFMVKLRGVPAERMREFEGMDDADRAVAFLKEHTVKLSDKRLDIPRSQPAIMSVNLWNANKPGTTLFMPISDVSRELINSIISFVNDIGYNFVDDLHGGRPPGTQKWIDSGLVIPKLKVPISYFERLMWSSICGEGAFIAQNLALTMQAMGLGGWVFGGITSYIVMGLSPATRGLGFRFVTGKGPGAAPNPVGIDGVFQAYCPPYYKDMNAAVDAVVQDKWGEKGIFTPEAVPAPYKQRAAVEKEIPRPPDDVIQYTKDMCTYIHDTYGRFPATVEAMNLIFYIQGQHIDLDFYDAHYNEGAYTETQKNHMALWHE